MALDDRKKTAFCTPLGLYHFTRMPFGLQNACATYGRMMRRVLEGLEQTDNFVDDAIIHRWLAESHARTVTVVYSCSRGRFNGESN